MPECMRKARKGARLMVDRISLGLRLQRLKNGYASDPKYVTSVIKSMGNTKIWSYLSSFEAERKRLIRILGISEYDMKYMTYRDVAVRIREHPLGPIHRQLRDEAIKILMLPLYKCYEERKKIYEQCGKNIP